MSSAESSYNFRHPRRAVQQQADMQREGQPIGNMPQQQQAQPQVQQEQPQPAPIPAAAAGVPVQDFQVLQQQVAQLMARFDQLLLVQQPQPVAAAPPAAVPADAPVAAPVAAVPAAPLNRGGNQANAAAPAAAPVPGADEQVVVLDDADPAAPADADHQEAAAFQTAALVGAAGSGLARSGNAGVASTSSQPFHSLLTANPLLTPIPLWPASSGATNSMVPPVSSFSPHSLADPLLATSLFDPLLAQAAATATLHTTPSPEQYAKSVQVDQQTLQQAMMRRMVDPNVPSELHNPFIHPVTMKHIHSEGNLLAYVHEAAQYCRLQLLYNNFLRLLPLLQHEAPQCVSLVQQGIAPALDELLRQQKAGLEEWNLLGISTASAAAKRAATGAAVDPQHTPFKLFADLRNKRLTGEQGLESTTVKLVQSHLAYSRLINTSFHASPSLATLAATSSTPLTGTSIGHAPFLGSGGTASATGGAAASRGGAGRGGGGGRGARGRGGKRSTSSGGGGNTSNSTASEAAQPSPGSD